MLGRWSAAVFVSTLILLVGCGGGGAGDTVSLNNPQSQLPTPTTPTNPIVVQATQTVIDYINIRHNQISVDFTSSETVLNSTLAAQGLFQSGAHYSQSGSNYVALVDKFLSDTLVFMQTKVKDSVVDKPTIAALLRSYQAADANFVSTYYGSVNWGLSSSGLPSFTSSIVNSVNTGYNSTIVLLP